METLRPLYATDRATYLVRGWKVADSEILAKLEVPEYEAVVEVYAVGLEYGIVTLACGFSGLV